jgi:hypothetical protein
MGLYELHQVFYTSQFLQQNVVYDVSTGSRAFSYNNVWANEHRGN